MKNVDWKSLRLVNGGPATRVPELVEQLQTKPRALEGGLTDLLEREAEEKRGNALVILRQGLVAEGKWCSASLPAAELLVELAVSDRSGRPQALALLADVLCADHRRLIGSAVEPFTEPEAQAVANLIASRFTELVACYDSPNPLLRGAIGPVLAFVSSVDVDPLLAKLHAETNEYVRGSLLLTLAHRLPWPKLSEVLTGANSVTEYERGVRALIDVGWGLTDEPSHLGPPLVSFSCHARTPEFGWAGGEHAVVLERVASHRGRSEFAVDALLAGLSAREHWTQCKAVTKPILVLGGFVERWPDEEEVALPSELSDRQREIAEQISIKDGLPKVGHGLPVSALERRRWLGEEAPGQLDRVVSTNGESLPLWRVIRHVVDEDWDPEVLPDLVENLPVLERTKTLGELCLNLYGAANGLDDDVLKKRFEEEVRLHATELGPWCTEFMDVVYKVTTPEYGRLPSLGGSFGQAIFYGLSANGVAPKTEWLGLVPWGGRGIRELLGNLPREFAAEAVFNRLRITYPDRELSTGVDLVLPLIDLVPSEKLSELLVAKMLSKDGRHRVRNLEQELERLRELAKTEPGIRAALERHGALENTPAPWDA